MSLQKGKHPGSAGQIPPQQRPQYPAAPAYGAPPPQPTYPQYILSGRAAQDASRVGEGGYGGPGGQGAHPNPVYATAGQNNNAGQMRASMQPPNPSSTPPSQQQPQQMSAADLSKHNMQQSLAGSSHNYQYMAQHRSAQQYLPRNPINQRMQQNHRPVAPNTLSQTQLGYSPQMPQMYANVMGPGMTANQQAVYSHVLHYPRGGSPYYAGQPAAVYQPFFLPYPHGQQNAAMLYNGQVPIIRGNLGQQQLAAPSAQAQAQPHQQQQQQAQQQTQQQHQQTQQQHQQTQQQQQQTQQQQQQTQQQQQIQHQQQHHQQQQQQQQMAAAQIQPGPMPMSQPGPMPMSQPSSTQGRRKNAIKIIDPNSGKDVLEELYESGTSNTATPPRSGESSARQTPQPSHVDVVAEFAAKVAIAAGEISKQEEVKEASVPAEPSQAAPSAEVSAPASAPVSPAGVPSNGPTEESKSKPKVKAAEPAAVEAVEVEATPEPVKEATPEVVVPAPKVEPVVVPSQEPVVAVAASTPASAPAAVAAVAPAWAKPQPKPPKPTQEPAVEPPLAKEKTPESEPDTGRNQWRQPKPAQKESGSKETVQPQQQPEAAPVKEQSPAAAASPSPPQEEEPVQSSTVKTAPATAPEQPPVVVEEEIKMVTVEDKLVAAKNEENSRITVTTETVIAPSTNSGSSTPTVIEQQLPDVSSKLVYSDDQWSPSNKDGKKKYERDFLMQLQFDSQSLKRPGDLPNLEVVIDKTRPLNSRPSGNMTRPDAGNLLMPTFMNQNSRGSLLRNKSSQQGKPKPTKVILNLSLNEDIKLNETENAWKPTVRDGKPKPGDVEAEEEDLFKKIRSILNKLTPQKFDLLVEQVKKMEINTEEKLKGVIDLVFDKAVDEPSFAETYAKLCQTLSRMVVSSGKSETKGSEGKNRAVDETVSFKKLLLVRCQEEFQKEKQRNSSVSKEREEMAKEFENAEGNKKKELELQLEMEDSKMRKKYVGVNRFIGELYKISMLNSNIMMQCISKLLESNNEESLECLCKLMTTIGQMLETRHEKDKKPMDLEAQIKIMKGIVKSRNTSSRIRFMLQDVIDLRDDNWKPRRNDQAPRTMDAIAKEAEQEQMAINMAQNTPMRGGGGGKDDRGKRGRGISSDDGWTVSGGGRMQSSIRQAPLDSSKLKVKQQDDLSLGSRNQFSNWSKGSSSVTPKGLAAKPEHVVPQTNNPYSLLSDSDKPMMTMSGSQGHDSKARKSRDIALVGKNSSSEGFVMKRHSRSNSRESSLQMGEAAPAALAKPKVPPVKEPALLSSNDLENKAKLLLEEYLNSGNTEDLILSTREEVNSSQYKEMLDKWILLSLEWSSLKRGKTASAMVVLYKENLFTPEVLKLSLVEILGMAGDIIIDIPKTFSYLAELFVPLIMCEGLSFSTLSESLLATCKKTDACKMLVECLHLLQKEVGPSWIQKQWVSNNLNWSSFVSTDIRKFLTDNQLTYLSENSKEFVNAPAMPSKSEMSPQEMHDRLVKLMSSMEFNDVTNYIEVNVGKLIKTPKYIRALMTTLCEVSVINKSGEQHKLNEDILNKFNRLICLYVDNYPDLELQALYSIQAFVTRLQHPPFLLRSILTNLLEESILSKDAIRLWIKSEDAAEQEGRGVALKSINQFITWLEEPDDSAEEGS